MSIDADGRELGYDDAYALGHEDGAAEERARCRERVRLARAHQAKADAAILREAAEAAHVNTAEILLRLAKRIEET